MRLKQENKQEVESALKKDRELNHLADKAGEALQVSPAPLLCK